MNWFIGYDYGNGIVIQAGNLPLSGSDEIDPLPAPYVLLNRVLKPLRVEKYKLYIEVITRLKKYL